MTPEEGRERDRIKREILNRPLLKLHLQEQHEARDTVKPGDGFRAGFLLLRKLWQKFAIIIMQFWYGLPFEYWDFDGWLWEVQDPLQELDQPWRRHLTDSGHIRAPFGGMIESIFRRRRQCYMCGKYFWRQGAFNPFYAVNIFEEHCSAKCSEDEISMLPY